MRTVQKKRSMSIRMSPGLYRRLLDIQREQSDEKLRQVSLNEVLCGMILGYPLTGKTTEPSSNGASRPAPKKKNSSKRASRRA